MKNQKNFLLLIPLFILAVVSFVVLGYQWVGLALGTTESIITLDPLQTDNVEIISLSTTGSLSSNSNSTENSSTDTSTENSSDESSSENTGEVSESTYVTDNGEFTVTSDDTLWEQYTSINIFNGLEIIAPGDHGEFLYTLSNDKDSVIDYTMTINKYEDETLLIPLTFRLKTAEGTYIGSDEWISGDMLEDVISTIQPKNKLSYVLEWQWDAYADDEYDTMLGQSELLTYTMEIIITAYGDGEYMNGIPQTGDSSNLVLIMIALCGSALFVIILVILKKNKKDSVDQAC
ncbi:MAG: LPXTG cell wall anchor domain-containing protein [Clostridia bacterium]